MATGLRYTSAKLDIRERVAFHDSEIYASLSELLRFPSIEEACILTTCNRVELYLRVNHPLQALNDVRQFFINTKQFDPNEHAGCLFTYLGEDAVKHLMSVSAGLDSLILGEGQILSQVKLAYQQSQEAGTCGRYLNKLFNTAIGLGKDVRHQTGISCRDASVSKAALTLALQHNPDVFKQRIAVVGGGKMASLILERLSQEVPFNERSRVTIVNRSPHRLDELTQQYHFHGSTWEGIPQVLADADVVFIATGAPHLLFYIEHFNQLPNKPRALYDISVPRNVDVNVGQLPHIALYNTDDLEGLHGFSLETEAQLRATAQALIESAYINLCNWEVSLPTASVIEQLRQQVEAFRQTELSHLGVPSAHAVDDIDAWSRVFINRLLHQPTLQLKQQASTNPQQASTLTKALLHWFNETNINAHTSLAQSLHHTTVLPFSKPSQEAASK
jgi:glutamyl-tRNA reductase